MQFVIQNYRLKVGDRVVGNWSKREITGRILEHPRRPGKAWTFSTGTALLCYIDTGIRKVAVTNIRRAGGEWSDGELHSKQLTLKLDKKIGL